MPKVLQERSELDLAAAFAVGGLMVFWYKWALRKIGIWMPSFGLPLMQFRVLLRMRLGKLSGAFFFRERRGSSV